jgi:hypothetical protein
VNIARRFAFALVAVLMAAVTITVTGATASATGGTIIVEN